MNITVNHVSTDVRLESSDGLIVTVNLAVEDLQGNAHTAIGEILDNITDYVAAQDTIGAAVQGFEDIDVELEDEDIDEGAPDYEWPATDFEDDGFAFTPDHLDTTRTYSWDAEAPSETCIICGEKH